MAVVVFGSINMDLVVRTPRLPGAGETLTGHTFFTASGGKGANQAVACARLGVQTRLVGRVGDDVFAAMLRNNLAAYGVDVTYVALAADQPSGVALIAVDDAAENTIIVVPGANGAIGTDDLTRLTAALADARILLLQLEIPLPAVIAAAHIARQRNITVVLDPAPARPLPDELYAALDVITPNESEAAALVGFPVRDTASAERAAHWFLDRGVQQIVIKLGSKGAYWHDGATGGFLPAFAVEAVDTVAAGDAFNGGFAAAISAGHAFNTAIRWGLAGGALSVTHHGAQPSMPDRAALLVLLQDGTFIAPPSTFR